MDFKNKNVLVFGFGILGGGLATTNWLLEQGSRVTVTDLKSEEQLADSLSKIDGHVELRLGGHSRKDIEEADILVINPDVSIRNEFIQYALELGKQVVNEATIFLDKFKKPIVAITGTRGKTTTTAWTEHFLKSKFRSSITGNSTTHPFLRVIKEENELDIVVAEIPSFHLELFDYVKIAGPSIAVITNISQDHLNRHQTIDEYASVKANIFKYQTSNDNLVLNYDDKLSQVFLKMNPVAKLWYFSKKVLPSGLNGIWLDDKAVYLREGDKEEKVLTLDDTILALGEHNILNLLTSALSAHLAGCSWADIQSCVGNLPQIPFRQEVILKTETLTVINDTTATSPEGTIQALKRFGGPETVLITGGTNRDLDFAELGKVIPDFIHPSNLVLLEGSATEKLLEALGGFGLRSMVHDSLQECVEVALEKASQHLRPVVLFSPASKSFEKFKNEYDRGEQFNQLIKKYGPDHS